MQPPEIPFHGIATFLVLDDTLILFVSDRIREQDSKFLNERRNNNHATEQPRNLLGNVSFSPRRKKRRGFLTDINEIEKKRNDNNI